MTSNPAFWPRTITPEQAKDPATAWSHYHWQCAPFRWPADDLGEANDHRMMLNRVAEKAADILASFEGKAPEGQRYQPEVDDTSSDGVLSITIKFTPVGMPEI